MKVTLIDYPKNPLALIATGARVCYSGDKIENVYIKMENDKEACQKMIDKIFESGHFSCFEHINFTFAIGDVSRVLSHQLVRHRIMSPHERSQRYVNVNKYDTTSTTKDDGWYCVIPDHIKNDTIANNLYIRQIIHAKEVYNELIKMGVPEEEARYILPGGTKTSLVVTFNARSLIHFFSLRCCQRSQTEMRDLATEMLKQVREVCPEVFNRVGPNCFMKRVCPEGKMSCGKIHNVIEKFEPDRLKAF